MALVHPGSIEQRTGGFIYDRRAFRALAARGWEVSLIPLPATFPYPAAADLEAADAALAGLPDGSLAVVDGLALGTMPEVARRHRDRIALVGLVHHPLYLETGLTPEAAIRLRNSEREALAAVCRVVCTSPVTRDTLVHEFEIAPERIAVALPGVRRGPLAAARSGPACRLLCVGTLTPRKAHALLLEALSALRDLPWALTCVGSVDRDPATVARVEAAIAYHRMEDRVRLAGELDGVGLEEAYLSTDLVVSASLYEGYGMALTEAVAHGLPIVAAAGGAVPFTVPAGAGLLVPPGDAAALADALRRVLSEPALRDELAAGARRARDRLPTWDDTAAAIERALAELV